MKMSNNWGLYSCIQRSNMTSKILKKVTRTALLKNTEIKKKRENNSLAILLLTTQKQSKEKAPKEWKIKDWEMHVSNILPRR